MYLIVQLFLLDNITIHLGFLLELRNFSSLEMCWTKKKKLIIWSQSYMNCSAVSHPQPAVESEFSTWLKFMPPLLQWGVTAVGSLCLEKQTIDLLELYCVCDFISKPSKGRRWAVKAKAKFLGTLGCLAFSSPHSIWWMHRIYTLSQNVI